MIPRRQLLPIPLPHGRTDESGSLSIHFTPRLLADGVLRDFPEWRDWPAVLAALKLQIQTDRGRVGDARIQRVSVPSSAAWRAVFGAGDLPVREWAFVRRTRDVFPHPCDARRLSQALLELQRQLAVQPLDGEELAAVAGAMPLFADGWLDEAEEFGESLAAEGDEELEPPPPDHDFHQAITILRAHPLLQRALGVVLDVEFPLDDTPPRWVAVRTDYTANVPAPADEVDFRMFVDEEFRPLSNPDRRFGDQDACFLEMPEDGFRLSCVDGLLGAQRLRAAAPAILDGSSGGEVPALRERGVSLIRSDVRQVLAQRFERQEELQKQIASRLGVGSGKPVDLWAEDVTSGYRYDVRREGAAAWRSLFARRSDAGYRFPADPKLQLKPEPDEGWQGISVTTEARPVVTEQRVRFGQEHPVEILVRDDLTPRRVSDVVFTWTGWSAAAPPPGRMLRGDRAVSQPVSPPDPTLDAAIDFRAEPGSLPRLRYGVSYVLRARAVDFAGRSRPLAAKEPEGTTSAPDVFGRLEPVEPPTVVRRSPRPVPGVGDLTNTVVIRSDFDVPDADVPRVDRLLFPPRLSQARVELHGLPEGGVDPDSYKLLAVRDAASLETQTWLDPVGGERVAGTSGGASPGPKRPEARYLVDPAVTGVAIAGAPQATDVVHARFGGKWPGRTAARLVVRAGDQAPKTGKRDAGRSFLLSVRKAETVHLELSCTLRSRMLPHFKLIHAVGEDDVAEVGQLALAGRHPQFSGRRVLTLIHAVRRPLDPPRLGALTAVRPGLGATTATFAGDATLHRGSTDRLVLHTRWTDPVDDPAAPAPTEVTTRAVLGRLPVADGDDPAAPLDDLVLNLHDTKRHEVRVVGEAFSRFARYFTEQGELTVGAGGVVLDAAGVLEHSVTVRDAAGTAYAAGEHFAVDGPSGRLTPLPGLPTAEPLTVRWIPRPVSRLSTEDKVDPAVVVVPSTAPPLAPTLRGVLPAFRRERTDREDRVVVRHEAALLRVEVERPWYSSGDGELLGVMVEPAPSGVPKLTAWARDPLVADPGPSAPPARGDFPLATATAAGVDGVGDVAAHAAAWDGDRGCWSADVQLAGDLGYRPFVRLALARYQPDAVAGAHLSPVVLAEPVRLGPTRTVRVRRFDHRLRVAVEGEGRGNRLTVEVQTLTAGAGDRELRWATHTAEADLAVEAPDRWATHLRRVDLPPAGTPTRLVLVDREPTRDHDGAGFRTAAWLEVYKEVVELPDAWLAGGA